MDYNQIQQEEAKTWLVDDPLVFNDKKQREVARYPMMAKQMGLNFIDTSNMVVADVGCGPFGGVSSVITCKKRFPIDPLAKEYAKIGEKTITNAAAEETDYQDFDLVIATNCIDHFQDPDLFFNTLKETLKPGGYFAHFHAINNADTHPHPAHQHNINPQYVHNHLDSDFETVWELKYPEVRYGWVQYQGKVGQPAFCGLFRKTTGYTMNKG